MSRGNPDYFGQSIVESVGSWHYETDSYDITSISGLTTILNKSVKGIIKKLAISIAVQALPSIFAINTYIDDALPIEHVTSYPSRKLTSQFYDNFFSINIDQPVNWLYGILLTNELFVNNTFKIDIVPDVDCDIALTYKLIYCEII